MIDEFQSGQIEAFIFLLDPSDRGRPGVHGERRFDEDFLAFGVTGKYVCRESGIADVDSNGLADGVCRGRIDYIFDCRGEIVSGRSFRLILRELHLVLRAGHQPGIALL